MCSTISESLNDLNSLNDFNESQSLFNDFSSLQSSIFHWTLVLFESNGGHSNSQEVEQPRGLIFVNHSIHLVVLIVLSYA